MQKRTPRIPEKHPTTGVMHHVISASDVIHVYKQMVQDKNPWTVNREEGTVEGIRGHYLPAGDPRNQSRYGGGPKWAGGDQNQMLQWLQYGYKTPGIKIGAATEVIAATRRRLRNSDDGELQVDLALSGFDQPYLEWSKRPSKPGLRIRALFNLNAQNSHEEVEGFSTWVRGLVEAVTTRGYDVSVEIACQLENMIPELGGHSQKHEVNIRIKNENEGFDSATWSAFLSPAGFRHLVFTAIVESAERTGNVVGYGLGHCIRVAEPMTFDPVTRLLTVGATDGKHFDPEQATKSVAFALGLDVGETDWEGGKA